MTIISNDIFRQSLFSTAKSNESNKSFNNKTNSLSFGSSKSLDVLVLHGVHSATLSKSRLAKAAIKRGHKVSLAKITECIPGIDAGRHTLFVKKGRKFEPLPPQDIVLTRLGTLRIDPSRTPTMVEQAKNLAPVIVNDISAIVKAHDKFRTHQILAAKKIPTPNTNYLIKERRGLKDKIQFILDRLPGEEVILKVNDGSQGIGVFKLPRTVDAVLRKMNRLRKNQPVVVQELLTPTEKATDIRCFVIGNRVIPMKRSGNDSFRSNLHLGGVGSLTELSKEEETVAIDSAKALGLEVAGVDLMRLVGDEHPFKIIEVNGNPGYGIIKETGFDVADLTVGHAEDLFWAIHNKQSRLDLVT